MADRLPLLIFPQFKALVPPARIGFPASTPEIPAHRRQVERLGSQMQSIDSEFQRFKGTIDSTMMIGEPEFVLVLELANRVDDLQRAVNAAGLEWLGEWGVDLEADEDFPALGKKTARDGRLFVSMVNQQGITELLSLWDRWRQGQQLPRGKTKWRDIFACLKNIRRWGMQETLIETDMKKYFEDFSDDDEDVSFQIECFYHNNQEKRRTIERDIRTFLERAGGETISDFIDMTDIAFHAVKARMSAAKIKALLNSAKEQIHLFIYPNVMFFRQTGQSMIANVEGDGEEAEYPPQTAAEQPPAAAILDGVPNLRHRALKNRVDFDDPFDLADKYQPGERLHGTAIASLIIHGDRADETTPPIRSQIHHVAVMQADEQARKVGEKREHFPDDCFYEDRIEQAVRRILEGDGETEARAATIKIINLSLGDPTRPFIHALSPWARLLDWLSWKYRVLFCVSAGNYSGAYDFSMPYSEYRLKSDEEKKQLVLKAMQTGVIERRLLAPAESINALTIGALHQDESGNYTLGRRVDLLPDSKLLSPVSCLGHGFRRSVKPEVYFPGGRQLYDEPLSPSDTKFKINSTVSKPGQKVARDSTEQGKLSEYVFSCGTSNATALATRAGVQIHEVLRQLNSESENEQIPDNLTAVLIKTLLVHGSMQNRDSQEAIECLKNANNSKIPKAIRSRFLGYGAVNIGRVLGCTEQRGTVIGCGEITTDKIHEYRFPVPGEFSGKKTFRKMVVTLAWFSPINTRHRYLREAKLEIKPDKKWGETPLIVNRTDGDYDQVKRGTVQHEILEGKNQLAVFSPAEEIVLQVICKKDATKQLEDSIPYGLAVTLEAADESQIPVYNRIRERLSEQVEITAI